MVKALFLDSKIIAFKYVDRRLINKEGQDFAVKCRFFRQKSLSVITFFISLFHTNKPMNKYGNELELILLLTDNHEHDTQELAKRLGVTQRNIYYYFENFKKYGFKIIKNGTKYRLDRRNQFFRKLHDSIALNDSEAMFLYQMLMGQDDEDNMVRSIKVKFERFYNLELLTKPAHLKRRRRNIQKLREAMESHKAVRLRKYSSPHSKTIADRIVEPYLFLNNENEVRCFELKTHVNKTFKISRTHDVEILDVDWMHEHEHKELFTDIFMFSGEEKQSICLELGQLSHNLLIEEYPQSEAYLVELEAERWLLKTEVVSLVPVVRFVLGLFQDIKILENEELKTLVEEQIAQMHKMVV